MAKREREEEVVTPDEESDVRPEAKPVADGVFVDEVRVGVGPHDNRTPAQEEDEKLIAERPVLDLSREREEKVEEE